MNNESFTNQTNQGLEIRQSEDEPTRMYQVLPNFRVAPAYTGIIVGSKQSKKRSTSAKVAIAISVIISALIVIAAIALIAVFESANLRRVCSEGYSILDCSLGN